MKFGAFVPQGWRWDLAGIPVEQHWPIMVDVARTIETSGYDSLWVYDHFQNFPPSEWAEYVWKKAKDPDWVNSLPDSYTIPEPTQQVTYEAWTLMAALAVSTTSVRLGQMCTCNTYRPPSYLAKVAASIDVISGGRLEMGIGAGWYEHEHDGYGYPFLKPSERIGMLREGVEIMRAMWTEDTVNYEGKHYQLKGAISQPKPLQKPHIPFWIAGGGEQLTLNIAARYAQYTNFANTLDEFKHKSEVLEGHCATVGTEFDNIIRSSNFNIFCAPTEAEVEEKIQWHLAQQAQYASEERATRFAETYRAFSGTPEQIVANLKEWQGAGLSYAIINFADVAYDTTGLELFAEQVIPELQS